MISTLVHFEMQAYTSNKYQILYVYELKRPSFQQIFLFLNFCNTFCDTWFLKRTYDLRYV